MFTRAAGLAFALALAATPATPRPRDPFAYKMVRVADHVYAFIETEINAVVSSNIIAVIGTKAILVFDAGHHPGATRSVIADIRKLSPLPVKYLVVSHWHEDHWSGAIEFAEAYPGLQEIAHPFTAKLMEQSKELFRGAHCRSPLKEQAQPLRDLLKSGKKSDGTPIPDSVMVKETAFLAGMDAMIAECDSLRYRPPDRTVDDALDLDLGGLTVSLRYLGRANTAGDLVAWLPDSRMLLTGDIVVSPWPYATQSYIGEWGRVLRLLEQINPAIIVPGHGEVMHDLTYVRNVALLMETIDRQARAAYKPGMTADELRPHIDIADLRQTFTHGDRFIADNFDYMILQDAVNREWQELAGKLEPEGEP